MYEQKDIVLIPFPYSDLTGSKQRPALIISNGKINKSEDRVCVLVTSNAPKDGVKIKKTENGELPLESWVKPHRLFTIHKSIIKKRICNVTDSFHGEIVSQINEIIK